ncbi:tetratricopeptide repeat protein [Oculatella sp. LEGE 06141]|uniref:tetratricopeptide repeat protein n=1 Tax=Oculatella sp. LEGE 06141 TaxID=1828648 RepID=UPI001882FAF1|nr:tetratricopeptide repeat protein [Oculatella sp. LEGE 06141]MBE9181416.1 tetratricopeptide repeat protein [Oculatella sp. LEGE 06141]
MTANSIPSSNQPIDNPDNTDLSVSSSPAIKTEVATDSQESGSIAQTISAAVSGGVAGAAFGRLVGGRFGATVGAVVGGVAGAAFGSDAGKATAQHATEAVQDAVQSASRHSHDSSLIQNATEGVHNAVQSTRSTLNQASSPSQPASFELPAETHFELGVQLGKQGQLDEAIAEFEQALAIAPDSAETHYNLGIALSKQNNINLALTHLQRAKELCLEQGNLEGAEAVERAIETVEQAMSLGITSES